MTPNASNTHSLNLLCDDEIAQFYEQGFFVLRNLFDENQLREMRAACEEITAIGLNHQLHAADQCTHQVKNNNPESVQTDRYMHYDRTTKFVYRRGLNGNVALSHVVGCGGVSPELLPHLRSAPLVHTFAAMMGHDKLQHLLCQFHPKLPGSGIVFKPHRDIQHRMNYAKRAGQEWRDQNGEGSYIVGIIAVDPMDRSNGGLSALAKSHHPKADLTNDAVANLDFDTLNQHPNYCSLRLNPGDIVFLHPYLLHWSEQNQTSHQTRFTLITGFAIAGANPNQNPLDYAGDSTHYLLQTHATGYTLAPAPWRKEAQSLPANAL